MDRTTTWRGVTNNSTFHPPAMALQWSLHLICIELVEVTAATCEDRVRNWHTGSSTWGASPDILYEKFLAESKARSVATILRRETCHMKDYLYFAWIYKCCCFLCSLTLLLEPQKLHSVEVLKQPPVNVSRWEFERRQLRLTYRHFSCYRPKRVRKTRKPQAPQRVNSAQIINTRFSDLTTAQNCSLQLYNFGPKINNVHFLEASKRLVSFSSVPYYAYTILFFTAIWPQSAQNKGQINKAPPPPNTHIPFMFIILPCFNIRDVTVVHQLNYFYWKKIALTFKCY